MTSVRSLAVIGATLATLMLAACGGGDPLAQPAASSSGSASSGAGEPIVVGSAAFTESTILAELYAQALSAKGVPASTKLNIGAREVYLKALEDGSIGLVPEYTGNLLLNYQPKTTATTSKEVEAALPQALP